MAEKKTVSVKLYNMAGEETGKATLSADVFGIEPNKQVIFDAIMVEEANTRQATAKTKVRHEVSGGGKKPWRQKGTGRARAGSSRSPIWVGGGTVFGPVGTQNYKLAQNKKEHVLATKSALSLKVKDGLKVVDTIKFTDKKTKTFVKMLEDLKVATKVLVVVKEIDENTYASANNVNWAKVVSSDNVSVRDIINADFLVISQEAAKAIEEDLK